MRGAPRWVVAIATLLVPGVAPARPRLALLPVDTVGVPAERGERIWTALARSLADAGAAEVAPRVEIDAALPKEEPARSACPQDPACVEAAIRRVGAQLGLAVTLSGLGDTHLIRLRLHDTRHGGAAREVRETVIGTEEALVVQARALAVRMLRDPEKPWYGRWWAWAAIGVGVAAAIAVPLALRDSGGGPEVVDLPIP